MTCRITNEKIRIIDDCGDRQRRSRDVARGARGSHGYDDIVLALRFRFAMHGKLPKIVIFYIFLLLAKDDFSGCP